MRSISSLALAVVAGGALLSPVRPAIGQTTTEELLLQRVQELEQKLQRLEEKLEQQSKAAPAPPVAAPSKPSRRLLRERGPSPRVSRRRQPRQAPRKRKRRRCRSKSKSSISRCAS